MCGVSILRVNVAGPIGTRGATSLVPRQIRRLGRAQAARALFVEAFRGPVCDTLVPARFKA